MAFHPVLSPSPLEKAFEYIASQSSSSSSSSSSSLQGGFLSTDGSVSPYRDNGDTDDAENDLPPFWLSPPEISLLRSAEENPLEYTLAETDDAVSYVRILLKMLDQVANNTTADAVTTSSPQRNNYNASSRSGSSSLQPTNNNGIKIRRSLSEDERILTLDTPPFSGDEAFDLYYRSTKKHKRLVVAHYCVTKIYEIICVSLEGEGGIPSVSKLFHGKDDPKNTENEDPDGLHTIHLENDDWRPLLKILYNRSSDEYTKRGSALILAYILKAGCEMDKKLSTARAVTEQSKPDEDLLFLFAEEHKTAISPASSGGAIPTMNTNNNNAIEDTLQSLISWLTSRLQRSGTYASLGVVTPTLGVLMSTTKQARIAFVQSAGIGYISRHLRAKRKMPPPSTQPQRLWPGQNSRESRHQQPRQSPVPVSNRSSSPYRGSISTRLASAVPQAATKAPNIQKSSYVTNGFRQKAPPSRNGSFASSVSSNLGLSELDILQSFPSKDDVEKNLESMFSSASAVAAAAIARSKAPMGLASLATSTSAAMARESPSLNFPKAISFSSSSSVQQLYDLVFCLWCLSLDCSTHESVLKHFARDGAVPALAHLLKIVPREKVLRMTLACLRSLSTLRSDDNEQPFIREMIGCGVLKSLEMVKLRRWNDVDLEDDLAFLQKLLADRTEELTQWSAYEAQIATGNLRWDEMLHTHDFFQANAKHMEGSKGDFDPLKRLVHVLYSNTISGKLRSSGRADEISYVGLNEVGGWDEEDLRDDEICETLAVCLFDIGEFARNYPNAKSVLGNRCGIGAKALIMQYVHHPRDEVREQALLCASKILVRNWRAIEQ